MANGQWLKAKKKSPKALFLFEKVVQSVVDAGAEVAQLVDFVAVAALHISASADKTPEETHIVPRQDKHKWEGNQIAQCPPYICKARQKYEWQDKADRYRYKYAYTHIER